MFVEYLSEKIIVLYTKEFVISDNMFDLTVHLDNGDNFVKNFVDDWYNSDCKKSIILSFVNSKDERNFFYFKNSFLNLIKIDIFGTLTSFKIKFESFNDVTRKYKISRILEL
jgi:hypothetical protein